MLALLASGWLIGLLVAPAVPTGVALALGVTSLLFAATLAAYGETLESFLWAVPLALAAFFAGLAYRAPPAPVPLAPGLVRATAKVESVRFRGLAAVATARILEGERLDGAAPLPTGALVDVFDADVPDGSVLRVLGRMQPPVRFRNPSPHPAWPRAREVAARIRPAPGSRVTARDAPFIARLLHSMRSTVRAGIDTTLGRRAAGLSRALVLGESASLGEGDEEAIRNLGLTHVLAVSGLHVAIVAGLAVLALERLLAHSSMLVDPRRWAAALGIPLAVVYANFAGAAPSAIRASYTACIAFGLIALGRKPRAIAVLAAAVVCQSMLEPRAAHHAGFLLSVISTAALLTATPAPKGGPLSQMKAAA
ncbi:MAG: ComEC/Rec2 family competence protein, partial [Polyangiaceae bacterium]|nr:ComEC/Rec2 family competence protein [Polyangiaceae bacterium]